MQIKEAVQQASGYVRDVFESAAGNELQLEGVERTDDSQFWKVTFSYAPSEGALGRIGRDYVTVKLRDKDGVLMGARNGMLLAQM